MSGVSWGSDGSGWVLFADGKMRQLRNGLWRVGRAYNPFLSRLFFQREKRRRRKRVSPSESRFRRRHGL